MRRYGWDDQAMPFPALDKITGGGERIFKGESIRGWKFEYCLGTDGAHAGIGGGPGDIFLKEVHIGEAGYTTADHFRGDRELLCRRQMEKVLCLFY